MSKKDNRKKRFQPPTLTKPELPPIKKGFWKRLKPFYKFWAIAFSFIGPISLFLNLLPVVSVPSSSSLNKDNPFSAPFIISNQSVFPITNVQITYELNKVNVAYGKSSANFSNSYFSVAGANKIGRHQSITRFLAIDNKIIIPDTIPKIDFAEVVLVIKYKYLLFSCEDKRSFKSYVAPDNTVTWLPK